MTLIPSDVSRGVGSMQSTGQKLTQASQPVQLSGITTAISFGFFFFRVIFAGASGMIAVGLVFLGSGPYANLVRSYDRCEIYCTAKREHAFDGFPYLVVGSRGPGGDTYDPRALWKPAPSHHFFFTTGRL